MKICRRLILALAFALLAAAGARAAASRHTVIGNVGSFPTDIAAHFGAVWVGDHRGEAVYRISPTGDVRKISIGESVCGLPVFGAGAVWVWGCDTNVTYRIDPQRLKVIAQREGGAPAFGAGSLWTLASNGSISRIDPKSGVVLARINPKTDASPNGGPDLVAAGSLWVSGDSSISRINVSTNKVSAVIPIPGARVSGDQSGGYVYANFATAAHGKAWLDNAAGVYVVDPVKNSIHKVAGVTFSPLSQAGDVPIVSGAGSVWVRTSDTKVVRIDPATEKVIAVYPASGGGGGVAVAFHSLWVVNAASSSVWRTPVGPGVHAGSGISSPAETTKPANSAAPVPTGSGAPAARVHVTRRASAASTSSGGSIDWPEAAGLGAGAVVLLAVGVTLTIRRRRAIDATLPSAHEGPR